MRASAPGEEPLADPFESDTHHLVTRKIAVSAELGYQRFCQVERIPEWLPSVSIIGVERRYPDGLPEEVRFESSLGGKRFEYTLRYVYDAHHLRIAWYTRQEEPYVFQGHCQFTARGDQAYMLYSFFEPQGPRAMHSRSREERADYARQVAEAFSGWLAVAGDG